MAPHSSTLAWKIPWTEESGGPQSTGSLRVGQDSATSLLLFTFMHWRRKWQPTLVFLPGESQRQGAWWAAVYGVAQSQTRLKQLSSSSSSLHSSDKTHRLGVYLLLSLSLVLSFISCTQCYPRLQVYSESHSVWKDSQYYIIQDNLSSTGNYVLIKVSSSESPMATATLIRLIQAIYALGRLLILIFLKSNSIKYLLRNTLWIPLTKTFKKKLYDLAQ